MTHKSFLITYLNSAKKTKTQARPAGHNAATALSTSVYAQLLILIKETSF